MASSARTPTAPSRWPVCSTTSRPGLVGPILRAAQRETFVVRAANLPDTDTIARSMWVGLTTARSARRQPWEVRLLSADAPETDHVVEHIQRWLPEWSAAPVFFVDQGLLREEGVDVGRDLSRGLKTWLETVAAHGVRVVLIDTIDKATGKRLLKKSSTDETGFLGPNQIRSAEDVARALGIRVLWAGGLGLRDAFEMGRLGVFGIYVTSAAATTIAVAGSYTRDPMLAGVKEPSREAVLRTKILLEAGFLSAKLADRTAARIDRLAEKLLALHDKHDKKEAPALARLSASLTSACATGWRTYWKRLPPESGAADADAPKES